MMEDIYMDLIKQFKVLMYTQLYITVDNYKKNIEQSISSTDKSKHYFYFSSYKIERAWDHNPTRPIELKIA